MLPIMIGTVSWKTALLALFACGLTALAEDLTTLDNKTYRDVRVVRADVDGLMIVYAGGGGKVAFTNLPPEIQQKHGYDPAKAAAAAQKQEKIKKLGRLGAVYRLAELTEAQTEARKEGKPLAFLATEVVCLQSNEGMFETGSSSATVHAFEALKNAAVLVFSDCRNENHTEPPIVDRALHPPEDVHYTPPKVVITDAELTKVIFVVPYTKEPAARQKLMATALARIKAENQKEPAAKKSVTP